jgi:hypothetical protein
LPDQPGRAIILGLIREIEHQIAWWIGLGEPLGVGSGSPDDLSEDPSLLRGQPGLKLVESGD